METRVTFEERQRGVLAVLAIRTAPGHGVSSVIAEALYDLRVQIVRKQTALDGECFDVRLDLVEFDGAALGRGRQAEIEGALRKALRRLRRAASRSGSIASADVS